MDPENHSLKDQCASMMARAMDWVVRHLDEFDPFKDDREFTIANGQRVTELATMLNSYVLLTGDRKSPHVRALIEEARKQQGSRALMDRMMHSPAEFVLFADLYAALKRLGYEDSRQHELIQRVIDAGYLDQLERVPHRLMDVRLTLEWGGFRHHWDTLEKLAERSLLVTAPNAVHLDEASVYSLTHVIMFLWGFGTRKPASPPLSAEGRRQFNHTMSMLLVSAAQQHHWDLLCELLLCWDCMGLPATRIYFKAWTAFMEMQDADGAVPGPERALEHYPREESDPAKQRALRFAHHYHTTLLAIIAGAVHCQRHPAPMFDDAGQWLAAERVVQSARFAETAARAQTWLAGLLDNLTDGSLQAEGTRRERICLELLAALWLCRQMTGRADHFAQQAGRIGDELARGELADGGLTELPGTLVLIGAAILAEQKALTSSLAEFLATSTTVLSQIEATDARSDLAFCEKRVLLRGLGLHEPPARLAREDVFTFASRLPLGSGADEVQALALRVNSYTSFGTQPVALTAPDAWLAELLVGFATHAFKEYDLPAGAKLLRAALGLGSSTPGCVRPGIDFLLLHQNTDGAFGFFGPVEAAFSDRSPSTFAIDLDVRLPVTLECLWTLAEFSNPAWRLFSALPAVRRDAEETADAR